MKAICVGGDDFRLYADSAIHRNNQPVFLPDIDGGWSVCICPAVRLSRLGMHISRKFAARYYDSIGAACIFLPAGCGAKPLALSERFFAMDSAFAVGQWTSAGQADASHVIESGKFSITFSTEKLHVDATIASLSEFMTFKMGDLLLFVDQSLSYDITEGDDISVLFDSMPCIDMKIK